ncbi:MULTISPECIES: hypothetical protein [Subtercola]|uniref:Uncharacterized protein n=1 Tax=Subtercola vilae TaxID=2056433 RepID=A0A4T2BPU8_9MICO|nr:MULTISPECIES: hypothetical protein [Subtercola]MEA9986488.1 hypothetical protein [Subtercola sp. RTI3]TIH33467.1 hypothetical protein D4765_14820 [Subtercola vilae]
MTDNETYRAELIGPNVIGNNEIVELPYVNGAYQDLVELTFEAAGTTSVRTWALGEGTVEPIAYNFVGEVDATPPNVDN